MTWRDPPADQVRSPGANACGGPAPAPLPVRGPGVVEGAVVRLEGVTGGRPFGRPDAAELSLRDCELEPAVQTVTRPGAHLALVNQQQRRRAQLTLDWLPPSGTPPSAAQAGGRSPAGQAAALHVADVPLVLVGQRVDLTLDHPGVVRILGDGDPDAPAYVVVPATPYVAVTSASGRVSFAEVPPGHYQVEVWLAPARRGADAIERRAAVEVKAGQTATAEVSLAAAGG